MTFAIFTHVDHFIKDDRYFGYAPYVNEMNLWSKYIDELVIVAPISKKELSSIHTDYSINNITFFRIPAISFTSFVESIRAIIYIPVIFIKIFKVMQKTDHIHLRCPGNIGLMGCLVQILFPKKQKTAKYAGNWDPNSKQPISYRLQKKLLSNTFLTRNMKVLVYGNWPNQSKNIKSFFTASYDKDMVEEIRPTEISIPLLFLFVGTLSPGKRPLYALQLVEGLIKKGINCRLDFYGDGIERDPIEKYIVKNQLEKHVILHGNKDSEIIVRAYKKSNFLVLTSISEGWPKVVAEAMFWGVIPIVSEVSCVPWMLGDGERGILLKNNLKDDIDALDNQFNNLEQLKNMSIRAQKWSHQYTLDKFETEIKNLL